MRIVLKTQDRKQELADFGWTMAQVPTGTGSPLKIADVRTIDLFVYDKGSSTPTVPIYVTGLDPTRVLFDTLRRNGDGASPPIPWTENNVGCNFAHYLFQGSVFVDPLVEAGGHTYRLEYRFATAAFGLIWIVRESTTSGIVSGGGGGGGPPPPNPDFNFAVVGANSQTVQQGVTTSFDFGISPINGFTADVTFVVTAVTPSIAHATFQFAPNPVTGGTGTTTMTVFTDAALTLPNTYQILVTATSGALSHVASVTLGITSSGGGSTGWTNFTASSDTIVHYVSSASGSDSNNGLTPATAYRTVLAGVNALRLGYPDWLLFSCGDEWNERFPQMYNWGRSPAEPLLISSYVPSAGAHAGSTVRPKFNCGSLDGMFMTNNGTQTQTTTATWTQSSLTLTFPGNPFLHYPSTFNWAGRTITGVSGAGVVSGNYTVVSGNNATSALVLSATICSGAPGDRTNVTGTFLIYANAIAVVGIHLYADGNLDGEAGNAGINWLGNSQDILIEDCKVEGFAQNIVIERTPDPNIDGHSRITPDATWMSNVIVRRNVVIDAHASVNQSLFIGNGVYTAWCNGIVVEENVLEHNGWRQDMRGSYQGFNRHNAYFQNSTHNATVRGNLITEADIQMRGGGLCENNLFLNNYICLQFGIGTDSRDDPAGVVGSITGNVALGGSNVGDGLRLIHAATWNEATLTLTVTDPPNPWAGQVANSMVGFTIAGLSGPPSWLDDSVSINFHCTGGTGATVTDPSHVFGGHRITASTTNTLTFDRSIGAAANGHADITGWTTYGVAQGSRGLFLYTGNVASATISNNIFANQFRIVSGKAVSDGPQPPGQNATLIEMTDGIKGGGISPSPIGCNNMTFSLNKIYNWGADNAGMPTNYTGGRMLHLERDNPGNSKYSGNKFDRNEYTNNISQDPIVNYAFANAATGLDGTLGNNHLWTAIADTNAWFQLPANHNLADWKLGQSPPDTTSSAQAATYTNPTADITSYLAQVSPSLPGVIISYQGYTDACRSLSKASGDNYWKALMPTFGAGHTEFGPLAYFRAAFS